MRGERERERRRCFFFLFSASASLLFHVLHCSMFVAFCNFAFATFYCVCFDGSSFLPPWDLYIVRVYKAEPQALDSLAAVSIKDQQYSRRNFVSVGRSRCWCVWQRPWRVQMWAAAPSIARCCPPWMLQGRRHPAELLDPAWRLRWKPTRPGMTHQGTRGGGSPGDQGMTLPPRDDEVARNMISFRLVSSKLFGSFSIIPFWSWLRIDIRILQLWDGATRCYATTNMAVTFLVRTIGVYLCWSSWPKLMWCAGLCCWTSSDGWILWWRKMCQRSWFRAFYGAWVALMMLKEQWGQQWCLIMWHWRLGRPGRQMMKQWDTGCHQEMIKTTDTSRLRQLNMI